MTCNSKNCIMTDNKIIAIFDVTVYANIKWIIYLHFTCHSVLTATSVPYDVSQLLETMQRMYCYFSTVPYGVSSVLETIKCIAISQVRQYDVPQLLEDTIICIVSYLSSAPVWCITIYHYRRPRIWVKQCVSIGMKSQAHLDVSANRCFNAQLWQMCVSMCALYGISTSQRPQPASPSLNPLVDSWVSKLIDRSSGSKWDIVAISHVWNVRGWGS